MIVALITNLIVVLGLALLALPVSRIVKRPTLLHGLWLLVLLRLFVPPLFLIDCLPEPWMAPARQSMVPNQEPVRALSEVAEAPAPDTGSRPLAAEAPKDSVWQLGLVCLWLAGSLSVILLSILRVGRFRRVLALAEPAPAALKETATALARKLGLGKSPEVFLIAGRIPPMVWARPRAWALLLPEDLLPKLSRLELETLILHELAHLRRKDHLVRLLELVAGIVFWWYPVVWWVRLRLRHYEELCCDGWVLEILPGARKAYADALVKTLELLHGKSQPLPGIACGIGHFQGIEERIRMIMKNRRNEVWTRGQKWGLLAAALLVLGLSPAWGEQQSSREKSSQETRSALKLELLEIQEQSRSLQGKLRELQERRQELEWEAERLASQDRLQEMREELSRLQEAGNQKDAEFVRENLRLLESQLDLRDQLRSLQRDQVLRMRDQETELVRASQQLEELEKSGQSEEAAALRTRLASQKSQFREEAGDVERESRKVRESLERLSHQIRENQVARLRYLGQEEEADALEREGQVEKRSLMWRYEMTHSKAAEERRLVERELEAWTARAAELEASGQTAQARQLLEKIEGRKRAIEEKAVAGQLKRVNEAGSGDKTKRPPR